MKIAYIGDQGSDVNQKASNDTFFASASYVVNAFELIQSFIKLLCDTVRYELCLLQYISRICSVSNKFDSKYEVCNTKIIWHKNFSSVKMKNVLVKKMKCCFRELELNPQHHLDWISEKPFHFH